MDQFETVTFTPVNVTISLLKCKMKLWVKLFLGTMWTSMSNISLLKMFIIAMWLVTAKMNHQGELASSFKVQVIIVTILTKLSAGNAPVLGYHILLASLLRWRLILGKNWNSPLNLLKSSYAVIVNMVPESPCMWWASFNYSLLVILLVMTWDRLLCGHHQRSGVGKVNKSAS